MSKNLTRKGLAFGALIALGTSVIAGAPALAAGIDNGSVSLIPTTGSEYNVLAGSSLDLKSNRTALLNTPNLKFLVTDPAQKIRFDADVAGTANQEATHATLTITNAVRSGSTLTITAANSLTTTGGDTVYLTGLNGGFAGLNGTTVTVATANSTQFTVSDTSGVLPSAAQTGTGYQVSTGAVDRADAIRALPLASASLVSAGITINKGDAASTATRATDGSYVIATNVTTNGADTNVRFVSTDTTTTVSGTVIAWVDDNGNNAIDSTEYQSPTRTIQFVAAADITPTVTFRPASVDDQTLKVDVTTSPELNGNQIKAAQNLGSDAAALQVAFTRQGSTKTILSGATNAGGSTTWDNVAKKWTVQSPDMNNTNATDTAGGTGGWAITQPSAIGTAATNLVSITDNVVTFKSATTHNLQVGDRVVVSGSTANTRVNSATTGTAQYSTVLSVPTSTSFTYKEVGTLTTAVPEVADTAVSVAVAGGNTKSLRNFVVAGTYTAKAYIYKYESTNALTAAGTAASTVVGATSASTVSLEGVASADVNLAGKVRKGVTSANVIAKVKNADGDLVGGGLNATITVGTITNASTSTFKVNGTSVVSNDVLYSTTDANGLVSLKIEDSLATAGDIVPITVNVQGASATINVTWEKAVYAIFDLNDATTTANGGSTATARSVPKGGSYTFNLLVQDQWKTALSDATIRLRATSTTRTVFDNFYSLTAGKVSIPVADGSASATATANVSLAFQKLTSGVWSDISRTDGAADDLAFINKDGASNGEEAALSVDFLDQTDKITLNADASDLPSGTTADLKATVVTKALKAIDLRTVAGAAETYAAANLAVVGGKVANSVSGLSRAGATVTASGTGLLFNVGDVWSLDTITFVANAGTFNVNVYSAASGDKKVTIASGAATATATITFTGASTTAKKLTITPSSTTYVAGQTLVYTILLTDTNGNPINTVAPAATPASEYITVSYAGPGIISGSLPVETDADGKATVRIVTGTADVQDAVLTVKYDQNFDGDYADTYDQTVLSTVPVLVVEPSAVVNVVGHRVYVKFNDAKGEEVSAVIGGVRITKTATYSGYVISKLIKKPGKYAVKAYVAGDLVKASTVTVK